MSTLNDKEGSKTTSTTSYHLVMDLVGEFVEQQVQHHEVYKRSLEDNIKQLYMKKNILRFINVITKVNRITNVDEIEEACRQNLSVTVLGCAWTEISKTINTIKAVKDVPYLCKRVEKDIEQQQQQKKEYKHQFDMQSTLLFHLQLIRQQSRIWNGSDLHVKSFSYQWLE